MAGVSASRTFKRTALALGLCLLAFCFAMEAKLAWYSPGGGSVNDIAAAKAHPADLPEVVAHGVPAPGPFLPRIQFVLLAVLATAYLGKSDVLPGRNIEYNHLSVSSAAYFSPSLFYRPPPVR